MCRWREWYKKEGLIFATSSSPIPGRQYNDRPRSSQSKNTSAAITALFSVGISDTARVSSQAISVIWSGRMKASNNTCKGKLFLKRFLWVCFYFVNKFICTTSFQILHERGVRWYFSFFASHTSLSMTTSRPIRAPSIGVVPFFLMAE